MVWVDWETTGLDALNEVPLEGGIILTDKFGRLVRDGAARWLVFSENYSWNKRLDEMLPLVRDMHEKSGLLRDLAVIQTIPNLDCSHTMVEKRMLGWLNHRFGGKIFDSKEKLPVCGSSVSLDRNFMAAWMPNLDQWFHYRIGDVSAVRIFVNLHFPNDTIPEPTKRELHRVMPDMIDSIMLYRHLMRHYLVGELDV